MGSKLTEAEAKAKAEREAQDALAHMPEPVIPQVASSFAANAEADEAVDKAAAIINDAQATDAFERRMAALEAQMSEQNKLLIAALERFGFKKTDAENGEPEVVVPPAVPLDAIISIYIPEGPAAEAGGEPVFVQVNGSGARYIPRGVHTQVTQAELEVLQHAEYAGENYPVLNDSPLARKLTRDHMTISQPVPYKKARFPLMVQQFASHG